MDTLRADAVSAYGLAEGTTPHFDDLAGKGLLYERAIAPSPWTIPSHASLFTGLEPDRHGVGIHGSMVAPEELVTLAEQLRDAGYETAGFSENTYITEDFGMAQGFESFVGQTIERNQSGAGVVDVVGEVARWMEARRQERPFFLFVNIVDPHDPYTIRDENPFVRDGDRPDRRALMRRDVPPSAGIAASAGICDRLPGPAILEILKGLYLGDVAAADAKVAEIWQLIGGGEGTDLITVLTSDHGEHLGEHRLLGHEFSVRSPVLDIPLVVHGLAGVAPARIAQPVSLVDVMPSILLWSGVGVPSGLAGRPLPTSPDAVSTDRDLLSAYTDTPLRVPEQVPQAARADQEFEQIASARRRGCRPEDRVFGDTISLLRYPLKLVWFEQHRPQLYDLSWDPEERSDQAAHRPELVANLARELEARIRGSKLEAPDPGDMPAVTPEIYDQMKALGYAD